MASSTLANFLLCLSTLLLFMSILPSRLESELSTISTIAFDRKSCLLCSLNSLNSIEPVCAEPLSVVNCELLRSTKVAAFFNAYLVAVEDQLGHPSTITYSKNHYRSLERAPFRLIRKLLRLD